MKVFYLSPILLGGFIYLLSIPQSSNAAAPPQNSNTAVPSSELQALTDIYYTMNGRYWINKANWLVGDPCGAGWAGITCTGGSVTSLNFNYNNLTGSVPNSVCGLKNLTNFVAFANSITGNMTSIFNSFSSSVSLM